METLPEPSSGSMPPRSSRCTGGEYPSAGETGSEPVSRATGTLPQHGPYAYPAAMTDLWTLLARRGQARRHKREHAVLKVLTEAGCELTLSEVRDRAGIHDGMVLSTLVYLENAGKIRGRWIDTPRLHRLYHAVTEGDS